MEFVASLVPVLGVFITQLYMYRQFNEKAAQEAAQGKFTRLERLEQARDLACHLAGRSLVLGYKLLVFCSGPDIYKAELDDLDRQYRKLMGFEEEKK